MNTIVLLLGGVALILYGVRTLRKGLDRLLGDRLDLFLRRAGGNPVTALMTGFGMALLAPSSTSVSTLAVQTVRAKHLSVRNMLIVLLGADIGLTMTVQLLSFKLTHLAPLLVLIGVVFYQYCSNYRVRGFGQAALAFGFLFLGIGFVEQAAKSVDPHGDVGQILAILSHHPTGLAIAAAMIAIGVQSSTATVGLLLGLAAGGGLNLSLPALIAAVAGANVGVGVTMLMIGWVGVESRRLAIANLAAKAGIAVLVLVATPLIAIALPYLTDSLPRQVANAHTGFNLLKALLVLPLAGVICRFTIRLVPEPVGGNVDPGAPRYLDINTADGNSWALSQSMREILRVAEIVRSMCNDVWRALREDDEELARQVRVRDDQVDRLEKEIKRFLTRLDSHALDPDQSSERLRQLQYLSELEAIGDVVDKNLAELVLKKIRRRVAFTPDAWEKLEQLDKRIIENMLIADAAFHTRDVTLAAKLMRHKETIDSQVRALRDEHLQQLAQSTNSEEDASSVELDLLTNLRRINSHVSHVAFALLRPDPAPRLRPDA